jgi:hypothetical protein
MRAPEQRQGTMLVGGFSACWAMAQAAEHPREQRVIVVSAVSWISNERGTS